MSKYNKMTLKIRINLSITKHVKSPRPNIGLLTPISVHKADLMKSHEAVILLLEINSADKISSNTFGRKA